MDIIWMLALGGMNLLCVLTGARIARKTGRKDRHPHVGAATSRPATADHERRKWASVCHPYDRSTPMGLGAMEGMENIQVAAGRQIAAPTRVREPGGGHGGAAKGFTQGGNRGAELTPQEKQLQTIWHNIERYDGTAAGQKEVTENFGFT